MKMKKEEKGVTAASGFSAAGIHCGLKKTGKKDLALIYSSRPAAAAGVFTQNRFQAAPVIVTRRHIASGSARAIVCNSGNANACSGSRDCMMQSAWRKWRLKNWVCRRKKF